MNYRGDAVSPAGQVGLMADPYAGYQTALVDPVHGVDTPGGAAYTQTWGYVTQNWPTYATISYACNDYLTAARRRVGLVAGTHTLAVDPRVAPNGNIQFPSGGTDSNNRVVLQGDPAVPVPPKVVLGGYFVDNWIGSHHAQGAYGASDWVTIRKIEFTQGSPQWYTTAYQGTAGQYAAFGGASTFTATSSIGSGTLTGVTGTTGNLYAGNIIHNTSVFATDATIVSWTPGTQTLVTNGSALANGSNTFYCPYAMVGIHSDGNNCSFEYVHVNTLQSWITDNAPAFYFTGGSGITVTHCKAGNLYLGYVSDGVSASADGVNIYFADTVTVDHCLFYGPLLNNGIQRKGPIQSYLPGTAPPDYFYSNVFTCATGIRNSDSNNTLQRPVDNQYIYGNLFYNQNITVYTQNTPQFNEGTAIQLPNAASQNNNVFIYNNTLGLNIAQLGIYSVAYKNLNVHDNVFCPTPATTGWFGTQSNSDIVATLTASISGTTMTVTANSGSIQLGAVVTGTGVAGGTTVTAFGTGTSAIGSTGTFTVSVSQSVGSEAMTADVPLVNRINVFDYNAYYLSGSLTWLLERFGAGNTYTSLTGGAHPWTNAKTADNPPDLLTLATANPDPHAITFSNINAVFTNAAGGDYSWAPGSPLIGAGTGGGNIGHNPNDVGPGW